MMKKALRMVVLFIAVLVFNATVVGCGGDKAAEERSSLEETERGEKSPAQESEKESDVLVERRTADGNEGEIAVGSLPEGFPADLLLLYPGGRVDRSAKQEGEFTVLQISSDSEATVYEFYKAFYEGKGWEATSKVSVAGRTVAGFSGPNKRVDMTLQKRGDGTTFFSLVLVVE
jgi:hypothetical protein